MELVSALTLPHVKLANPIKLVSVFKKAREKIKIFLAKNTKHCNLNGFRLKYGKVVGRS